MTPGGWRGGALAACLALGLWACKPNAALPGETLAPALPSPQGQTETPATPLPAILTGQADSTPTLQPATPTHPPATPTSSPTPSELTDNSLVAQYAPWSLGHAVAWSPDGMALAASAGDSVYFYNGRSLQEQRRIDIQTWGAGLAFSPVDNNLLAVAGRDGTLQLWDVAGAKRLAHQHAHEQGTFSVAFSPDGNYLATSGGDPMVRLWLVSALLTGQQVEPLAAMIGGAVAVPVMRYSPAGSLIASIDLQVMRLRNPFDQRLVRTLHAETSLFSLAFSPDGGWLVSGEAGNQVRVWEVSAGAEIMQLRAGAGSADPARAFVWSLDFSPDGSLLAAGSSAGTLTLWSLPGGEIIKTIQAHEKAVSGLAFDPLGGRIATCGLDATLRVWTLP